MLKINSRRSITIEPTAIFDIHDQGSPKLVRCFIDLIDRRYQNQIKKKGDSYNATINFASQLMRLRLTG